MDPGIDVIIPTYNRPLNVQKILSTLREQLDPQDRIYIVWQGTQKPVLDNTDLTNIIILYSSPPNLPLARNVGLQNSSGDIVLFLDDDVEALPGLIKSHKKEYTNITIGAVAGRVDDTRFNPKNSVVASFDETTGNLVQNFCLDTSCETISIMGANMSFRRRALLSIGLFDKNYKHNALWEDVDMAFRIRKAGFGITYCHDAKVKHYHDEYGGCRTDKKLNYLFHQFANTAYFAKKHALKKYYASWIRFWWYRLEYQTRIPFLWMRHNPFFVLAGIMGVLCGIAR